MIIKNLLITIFLIFIGCSNNNLNNKSNEYFNCVEKEINFENIIIDKAAIYCRAPIGIIKDKYIKLGNYKEDLLYPELVDKVLDCIKKVDNEQKRRNKLIIKLNKKFKKDKIVVYSPTIDQLRECKTEILRCVRMNAKKRFTCIKR